MDKISFEITTPEGNIYKSEVDEVSLPTKTGEITILPHHIPLVSALIPGELRVKNDNQTIFLAVAGGFIEVQPNSRVVVLADNAEMAEKIDLDRAEQARKRAVELMKEKAVDDVEYTALASKIERELARIRVARKHRSHRLGLGQVSNENQNNK
ncbi:MAG TPA: F0F1 ATP synthase subunit epsilon [Candidatus Magasanikbacteria bacterium]|nr:F0F1 ATP synthase subunit epsilon [Candidatus Magasanikbacteria bacterium]